MKVLVIQPKIGMGDMVIYLPYIHAISKKYQTPLSILVKENSRASQLLAEDKHIKEILILDRTKNNSGTHDGLSGFFRLVKDLKFKEFDKVFIFNSSLRYLLISKIAGIKNISQYPLFRKKDNVVTSAKIFTENELGEIVSTQPELIISDDYRKTSENKQQRYFFPLNQETNFRINKFSRIITKNKNLSSESLYPKSLSLSLKACLPECLPRTI